MLHSNSNYLTFKQDNNLMNRITKILLIIYLIVLCWILLFKLGVQFSYMEKRSVNFIPFKDFFLHGAIDTAEALLNVIIFVPLGIYTGVLFKRWALKNKLFFFFFNSLVFEGLEFLLKIGMFDITDIITNTVGGIAGLMIFEIIEKFVKDRDKTQRLINILALIATAVTILLLVLLKMNLLPVRYQ